MIDIIKIQNLFIKLVQQNDDLKYYHFGWLSDMDINIENVFNQEAKAGRQFPCLDWIIPDDISFNIDDPEKENIKMCLYFSDLQGYNNKGAQDSRTQIEVWRDLWKIAKPFLLLLSRSLCELNFGFIDGQIRYEMNAYGGKQRRQDLKFSFNLVLQSECFDIDGETIPDITENCDLENYCHCQEIV